MKITSILILRKLYEGIKLKIHLIMYLFFLDTIFYSVKLIIDLNNILKL